MMNKGQPHANESVHIKLSRVSIQKTNYKLTETRETGQTGDEAYIVKK